MKRSNSSALGLLMAVLTAPALAQVNQSLLIGSGVPNDAAIVQIESTSQGFLMPGHSTGYNSTTKSRSISLPSETGLMFYDKEGNNICLYDGSANAGAWKALGFIPVGGIVMWKDANNIPPGWQLCDGTNGTPNLSDRFVVGYHAGDADYNSIGKTGGAASVTLSQSQIPAHSHSVDDPGHSHTASLTHSHSYSVPEYSSTSPPAARRNVGNGGTPSSKGNYTTSSASFSGTVTIGNSTAGVSGGSAGGGQPHENRPPYYVVAFIMRMQ